MKSLAENVEHLSSPPNILDSVFMTTTMFINTADVLLSFRQMAVLALAQAQPAPPPILVFMFPMTV